MVASALLMFAQVIASNQPPTAEDLVSAFERFCVETRADRHVFDAKVNEATEWEKVSAPSLFSGVEFHRRWRSGAVGLSFTDAPHATLRLCGINANALGGFDGEAIAMQIGTVTGATLLPVSDQDNQWAGSTPSGDRIIVINRPSLRGYGSIEINFTPA